METSIFEECIHCFKCQTIRKLLKMFLFKRARFGCLENFGSPKNLEKVESKGIFLLVIEEIDEFYAFFFLDFQWPLCWPEAAKTLCQLMFDEILKESKHMKTHQKLAYLEIALQSIQFTIDSTEDFDTDILIQFLYDQTMLYAVQDPPERLKIFTAQQCIDILYFLSQNFSEQLSKLNFFCNIPTLMDLKDAEVKSNEILEKIEEMEPFPSPTPSSRKRMKKSKGKK